MQRRVDASIHRLSAIAEAQEKASFSILTPQQLPEGTRLVEIHYGSWPGKEGQRGFDWVELFYQTSSGDYLSIRQGNTGYPLPDGSTPVDAHGTVLVQGRSAIWLDGQRRLVSHDPLRFDGWQRGVLSLSWDHTKDAASGLPRTVSVTGKADAFTLTDPLTIAESLR